MKVLVVGRGGREHAICKKLKESVLVEKVFCAPGNAGIAEDAELVKISEMDFADLADFVEKQGIELTVVGPEAPLAAGIVDFFQKRKLAIFGPNQKAAELESSKSFAKKLMAKYQIPTASYAVFEEFEDAKAYIVQHGAPIVLKADGLAAGKGVTVAMTTEEALAALEEMLIHKKFGEASSKLVIEEYLQGEEYSLMAFVHGEKVYPMAAAQDHKRAYDGDNGPNTGGMGAYSPVPHLPAEIIEQSVRDILEPCAKAMVKEGRPFTGVIFAGLMLTKQGPKTIEFNVRFGDPETQVVLPRLESDLAQVFLDVLAGKAPKIKWKDEAVLGVVLASKGYPGSYQKGVPIQGIQDIKKATVYHAGTIRGGKEGRICSDGGRVLVVAASGASIKEAQERVYQEMKKLDQDSFFYRKDIGARAIARVFS